MIFPKQIDIKDTDKPQCVYTCDSTSFPYVGLKENTIDDESYRSTYPYIPCCYKEDQNPSSDDKITNRKRYYDLPETKLSDLKNPPLSNLSS
jgi:hypothetical protein